jgi:SAM-dependent methyltransferase
MREFYFRDTCRLCKANDLRLVFSLTPTPPGNHFVTAGRLDEKQKCYPLDVYFCNDCTHLQLGHVVNPEILYRKQYSYVSATSPVFVRHLRDFACDITDRYRLNPGGLVIDVGSNDGTALRFFQEQGYRVLGIDPATEIADRANRSGIETLCEFFGLEVAEKFAPSYGPAALITAHNSFAHIDDLETAVKGAKTWLADDGLLVVEVGYLLDVYQNMWFDTIYHEHLDFHSVAPFVAFFARLGMQVVEVIRTSSQGGSIRVIVQKDGGGHPVNESVQELIALERRAGLQDAESFVKYGERIEGVKEKLTGLLAEVARQGKSVAGFGAPTKATTLLYHFNLASALAFLVDENPLKQGMYTPGSHIPVYSAEAIYERRPDYLLILAWNFAEDIMRRHSKYRDMGGHFIVPMPEARIIA